MSVPTTVTIYLYNMNRDEATIGKFSNDAMSFTCVRGTFRGPVDLISPTLNLERGESGVTTTRVFTEIDINQYNYFKIVELNRSYFITGCNVSPVGIMTVTGMEDFIETYRKSIYKMTAFCERCEAEAYIDETVPDTGIYAKPNLVFTESSFSPTQGGTEWKGCYKVITDISSNDDNYLCYLITFSPIMKMHIGDGWYTTNMPSAKILMTKKAYGNFTNETTDWWSQVQEHFGQDWNTVLQSIEVLPFPINKAGLSTNYLVDGVAISGSGQKLEWVGSSYYIHSSINSLIVNQWQVPLTDTSTKKWWTSEGYRHYYVKFEPFGQLEIPANDLLGHSYLSIRIETNLWDGSARLYYSNETGASAMWKKLNEAKVFWQVPFVQPTSEVEMALSYGKQAASIAATLFTQGYAGVTQKQAFDRGERERYRGQLAENRRKVNERANEIFAEAWGDSYQEARHTFENTPENRATLRSDLTATRRQAEKELNLPSPEPPREYVSDPSNSTAVMLTGMSVMKSVLNLPTMPSYSSSGSSSSFLQDATPKLIVQTFVFEYLPIHRVGRPCYQEVTIEDLSQSGAQSAGYFAKFLYFDWNNFGDDDEPVAISYEKEQIANILTTGVYLADISQY